MGVRIHALAKELGVTSKELMAILQANGIKINSHLSSIHQDIADKLRKEVGARGLGGADAAVASTPRAGNATRPAKPAPAPTGKSSASAGGRPGPVPPKPLRKGPILARPGPIIARSSTPAPSARPRPGGEPARRGPGGPGGRPGGGGPGRSDSAPSGDAGRSGRRRFFPGQQPEFNPPAGRGRHRGPQRGRGDHRGRRNRQSEGSLGRGYSRRRDELPADRPSKVDIQLPITLKDLSPIIGIKQPIILKTLMTEGVLVNVNSHLNAETLFIIGEKFSVEINTTEEVTREARLEEIENAVDSEESLQPRAPMVTLLGHVDHGKTSLLDKIRETRVTAGEAGGITQHMSAYRVDQSDNQVVFIDTPGHKAFTEMRARGANVTDVVVLVVAADDGPMPQTEEAIQHARAAGVKIVVAINKIDKANANVDRVKQQLAALELTPPEWGGDTEMIPLSAHTGQGIDDLLEVLSLETQILDLRASPAKPALGTVLDAKATGGRGIVTTAIIQAGTLRPGDHVLCGSAWGKVRTLQTTTGLPVSEAGPSTPVEITGLSSLPGAGDRLYCMGADEARAIAEDRQRRLRESERAQRSHVTLENLASHLGAAQSKQINILIRADVKGSLEVVRKQLEELATGEVGFKILLAGVGEVTESDVLLADASDAIILGFHVTANDRARSLAEEKSVEIRTYQVIYQLLEDMQLALEGVLEPDYVEEIQGTVEIRQLYRSTKLGNIAGCFVRSGVLRRDHSVRLIREGTVIYQGKLGSLKRFKDDANEVKEGFECGLRIENYNDVKVGDIVESYVIVAKARKLSDSSGSTR